jgi:murein DD-endopeptidase MepM/ murein hydrolase activator NlpD
MARPTHEPGDALTLMLVPGRTGQIRRITLPRRWLRTVAWCGAAAAVLLVAGSVDYVRVRGNVSELDDLRSETAEQRAQIDAYALRMEKIADELGRLGEFDRKLRVIANLEPGNGAPLAGIGGIESDDVGPGAVAGLTRARRHERLMRQLDRLTDASSRQGESLQALIAHLEGQAARLASTPSIAPAKGWITSTFGYRTSPFTGMREFHQGLDVAGRSGTPIVSSGDGRVRFAGPNGGLGNAVVVVHGYGIETTYGHLAETLVRTGDRVKRGDRVGLMGSTGRSTGPHLHYQVSVNGVAVNPANYILD